MYELACARLISSHRSINRFVISQYFGQGWVRLLYGQLFALKLPSMRSINETNKWNKMKMFKSSQNE